MKASELMPKLPLLLADLETMHKARVIHRDISPDNIILMPDGKLKLLDFGSARSVQDGKSMTVMLKAGFSPVEQYQSKGQDAYTDVYALAATIYYCLTGVVPPSSVNRLDKDSLVGPNQHGAGLTPQQEQALLDGMIVQPKLRPQSIQAFAAKLFPDRFRMEGGVREEKTGGESIGNSGGSGGTGGGDIKIFGVTIRKEDKLPIIIGIAVVGVVVTIGLIILSAIGFRAIMDAL